MKIPAWLANGEAVRSMWLLAAEKSKLIEKDGEWLLKWNEPHRNVTGDVGRVDHKMIIGKSTGESAITEAEAGRIAEDLIISKLRERSIPPPEPADLRAKIEAMRQLPDDAPEWPAIMEKVFKLPITMLPFLQAALKARRWVQAFDPVSAVRRQAQRLASHQTAGCGMLSNTRHEGPAGVVYLKAQSGLKT